ncbi:MAG: hypothetical protein LBK77_06780, partial [Spirochaetaceae bacterium]|nr:hypothetical protein [Spirochaetaceae bacterium]
MKKRSVMLLSAVWALGIAVSCTSVSPPGDALPAGDLYFVPQDLPEPAIPPDAGARSEDPDDEAGGLKDAFRQAYAEALFRGLPLTGVLGSDRIHAWPAAAPESWTQNWTSQDTAPNPWGIPGLVLALGDYRAEGESPVYTVSGPVLYQYGKSGGLNRSNGAAGYGIPLGELFFENGAAVQRFTKGRIIVDREGTRFVPGEDPAADLLRDLLPEDREAEFGGRDIPPRVSAAFAHAWAFAFAGREWTGDGPVERLIFPKPWILFAGPEEIALAGLYIKSFNSGEDIFVLADAPQLPLRAHHLRGSILDLLAGRKRLPGLEQWQPLGSARTGGADGVVQALVSSFAVYGPPLSDALPRPVEGDAGEGPLYLEAQRFARGWIVVKT